MRRLRPLNAMLLLAMAAFASACHHESPRSMVDQRTARIIEVVDATEEGYLLTDHGRFWLPNSWSSVGMEDVDLSGLLDCLRNLEGRLVTLGIVDETVVNVRETPTVVCAPSYFFKERMHYEAPPLRRKETLRRVEADTYRLSLITKRGVYYIYNDYAYRDYYEKVFEKVRPWFGSTTDLNITVDILYHETTDEDCLGEVEDIEIH